MKKIKKRWITLVEIMIVMFLIAMITGVIAYNYTGSLEEGKAFKTVSGIEKIKTILALEAANGSVDVDKWQEHITHSPLVQNPKELTKDGWGNEYDVRLDNDGNVVVTSKKLNDYYSKNGKASLFKTDKEQ